jgi:DNA repair protein RecO (recombination protein O)
MAAYSATAVALRIHRLGESDRIVVLLASDGRQIRAVAKGSRKSTSRFAGRVRPYVVADLLLATGRSLDVVSEVEVLDAHDTLTEDLDRAAAASAVAELAERLSAEGDPEPRVYQLTLATLAALESAAPQDGTLLTAAYYAKALAMHGWRPRLGTCMACGGRTDRGGRLSSAEGGMLCPGCDSLDPLAPEVGPELQSLLAELIGSTLTDLSARPHGRGLVRGALLILRDFAVFQLGSRLRAVDFLLTLSETG